MSNDWQNTVEFARAVRRELHLNPELSWHEHETAARIRQILDELHIRWRSCAGTGTVALINEAGSSPAIALRADIDALPIKENSGVAWSSENEGCMHACGHDGHTAALLGTAKWLKQHESSLQRQIVLLFQPESLVAE